MSISEFLKKAKHEELVRMSDGITIYRVQYGINGQETRFYYFQDGSWQKWMKVKEKLIEEFELINNIKMLS